MPAAPQTTKGAIIVHYATLSQRAAKVFARMFRDGTLGLARRALLCDEYRA
jgi:hypothetical protein